MLTKGPKNQGEALLAKKRCLRSAMDTLEDIDSTEGSALPHAPPCGSCTNQFASDLKTNEEDVAANRWLVTK